MGTTLHLIRHASHDLLGRVLVGRAPVPVSMQGEAEALALARQMAHVELAAVVSSPQLRATQTAEVIARSTGTTVQLDPGLDEIDFGEWTGARFDTLEADMRWRNFNVLRGMTGAPGGETMLAAQVRAVAAVMRLRVGYPNGQVAVVSHSDILKAILVHVLGMSLDLMQRIELSPASRSVLVLHDQAAVVQAINISPT